KTPPAISQRSFSACRSASRSMMAPRASAKYVRACRRRSASIRGLPCKPASDCNVRHRQLAQEPAAIRRDVLWRVHGAARHPDRRVITAIHWWRTVGGTGRDQLGADRLPDRRDRRHSNERWLTRVGFTVVSALCALAWSIESMLLR